MNFSKNNACKFNYKIKTIVNISLVNKYYFLVPMMYLIVSFESAIISLISFIKRLCLAL